MCKSCRLHADRKLEILMGVPAKMTEVKKQHFIVTLKSYLWWGE